MTGNVNILDPIGELILAMQIVGGPPFFSLFSLLRSHYLHHSWCTLTTELTCLVAMRLEIHILPMMILVTVKMLCSMCDSGEKKEASFLN